MSGFAVDVLMGPNHPSKARELARYRDRGPVVTAALGDGKSPLPEVVERAAVSSSAACGGQQD